MPDVFDQTERFEDEEETTRQTQEEHQSRIWTSLPIIIGENQPDKNTCTVDPALKLAYLNNQGKIEWKQIPTIKSAPLLQLGGGGTHITIPVQQGDEGLAIFSSRGIDNWWANGKVQNQDQARMHHLTDAFIIPGFHSQPKKLASVSTTTMQLRTTKPASQGGSHFEFDPANSPTARAAGQKPSLTMTIESAIRINSFAGGILHAAGIALPAMPSVGQMIHTALNDISHNSQLGNILHTAAQTIGLNVGGLRDIEERESKFAAGVSINLNSPIVQVSAQLKAYGSIDASGGFFVNGVPIGSGGGGGGSSNTVGSTPPPSPVVGQFWYDTTDITGGQLYTWYNDGTSAQWVPVSNVQPGPAGPQGPPGAPGSGTSYQAGQGIAINLGTTPPTISTAVPYLPIAGGTLTGLLTLSGPPTVALHAATKAYVDAAPNQTITISGDATGSGTAAIPITLANTAVTPGSYTNTNLTVDSKGRITAASTGAGGGGSLSGMTAGQIPIAATATTVTSSIPTTTFLASVGGTLTGILTVAPATGPATGTLLVSPAASNSYLIVNKASSGFSAALIGGTNLLPRWSLVLGSGAAETGSNAGSDFAINRFSDAGGLIDTPLSINRATGVVTIGAPPAPAIPTSGDVVAQRIYLGPSPSLQQRNTAAAIASGGLWQLALGGLGNFGFQMNTAAAGDFSTILQVLTATPTGGVYVGTPTAPAGGYLAGDLNATRVLINGTPISVSGGSFLPLTGGTISGSPGTLTINTNTAAAIAPMYTGNLAIFGADSANVAVELTGSNATPVFVGRRSAGTLATPSPTPFNVGLVNLQARGRGTTGWTTTPRGVIVFNSSETWTDTAQGVQLLIATTPKGTAANVTVATFGSGLTLGTGPTAGTDTLLGTLTANSNASAMAVLPGNYQIQTQGADGTNAGLAVFGIGANVNINFFKANGILGTGLTAIAAGDNLGRVSVSGWTSAAAWATNAARIQFTATEPWTATAIGNSFSIQTTAIGTTAVTTVATFGQGLILGTPSAVGVDTPRGTLICNLNTAVPPALPSGVTNSPIRCFAPDGQNAHSVWDSFGASGGHTLIFRSSGGTAVAPSATPANYVMGAIAFWGYGATTYIPNQKARVWVAAAETWTDSATGTFLGIDTTRPGQGTVGTAATFSQGLTLGVSRGLGADNGTGTLIANANAAVPIAPFLAGNVVQMIGVDGIAAGAEIVNYGAGPAIVFRRTNGIGSAPTAIIQGQQLGAFQFRAYGATGWGANAGTNFACYATETWTDTAQGAYLAFQTRASGTNAVPISRMVLSQGVTLGSLLANGADNGVGTLICNMNAGAPIAFGAAGTGLQIQGADGTQVNTFLVSFGAAVTNNVLRANGTLASLTPPLSGQILGRELYGGWTGSAWNGGMLQIVALASENWSATANGNYLQIATTNPGTIVVTTQVTIGPGLTVGTPTAPVGGIQTGDLNATRVCINGTPISTSGAFLPLAGGTLTGLLTINLNTAAFPNGLPSDGLRIQNADGANTSLHLSTSGATTQLCQIVGQASGGTAATPAAITSAYTLLSLQGRGYNGTAWSGAAVQIAFVPITSPWTASDTSTRIQFVTTPVGSTTFVTVAQIAQGLTLGTPLASGTDYGRGSLIVNQNTAVPATLPNVNNGLHLQGADNATATVVIYAIGGNPTVNCYRSSGTAAAPSAVLGGQNIGRLAGSAFGATAWQPSKGWAQFTAQETWTDTATGTHFELVTTPIGSSTALQTATLGQGLTLGTPPAVGVDTLRGTLIANRNVSALITSGLPPSSIPIIQVMAEDGQQTLIVNDSYGSANGGQYILRRANGTAAAPTRVNVGELLGSYVWRGYAATGFSGNAARISAVASENFTDTAQGANFQFVITLPGTLSNWSSMIVSRGVTVGVPSATVGADNGVGSLICNMNSAVPTAITFPSPLQLIGADNANSAAYFDGFGTGSGTWEFRHAGTSAAAPSQTPITTLIMQLATRGYTNAAAFGGQNTRIRVVTTEAQTSTAQGAAIQLWATPTGFTIGSNPQATLQNGLQLGQPTGGDKGSGTLNASAVYAGGIILSSDASLKRDIKALPDDCLALVAAIEPRQYKFKEPPLPEPVDPDGELRSMSPPGWADRTRWGFVAQDVERAMQGRDFGGVEVDEDGLRSLDYNSMIAVLWKSVQELTAEVAAMKKNYGA